MTSHSKTTSYPLRHFLGLVLNSPFQFEVSGIPKCFELDNKDHRIVSKPHLQKFFWALARVIVSVLINDRPSIPVK